MVFDFKLTCDEEIERFKNSHEYVMQIWVFFLVLFSQKTSTIIWSYNVTFHFGN